MQDAEPIGITTDSKPAKTTPKQKAKHTKKQPINHSPLSVENPPIKTPFIEEALLENPTETITEIPNAPIILKDKKLPKSYINHSPLGVKKINKTESLAGVLPDGTFLEFPSASEDDTIIEKTHPETPSDVLTAEEMSTADNLLKTIDKTAHHYSIAEMEAHDKAEELLAALGNKVLLHIRGKLSEFEYSRFVEYLAEPKDLEMVLDYMDSAVKNPDGSTLSNLIPTLQRLIYAIRKADPKDPRLSSACKKLIGLHKAGFKNPHSMNDGFYPIALTGTPEAKQYIQNALTNLTDGKYYYNLNKCQPWVDDLNSVDKSYVTISSGALNDFAPKKQPKLVPHSPSHESNFEWIKPPSHESNHANEGQNGGSVNEGQNNKEIKSDKKPVYRVALGEVVPIASVGPVEGSIPTEAIDPNDPEKSSVYPEKFVEFFAEMEKLREANPNDEDLIKAIEKSLGIETPLRVTTEAALLIDWQLFCTSIISGNKNQERMFGDKEWTDWITARLGARAYGNGPLTPDFIKFIHSCLTKNAIPQIGGKFRHTIVYADDYSNAGNPAKYTAEQVAVVNENPLLRFVQEGEDPNTGFIHYPNSVKGKASEQLSEKAEEYYMESRTNERLITCLVMDLCDWYNVERSKPHDPYELAAKLQRRLVAIHPFGDVNGRTSRLLMNWSLENDNVDPAIVYNPDGDILTPEKDWSGEIRYGSDLHYAVTERRTQLEAIGYEDTAELMGLSEVKTFYDLAFSKLQKAPDQQPSGETIDRKAYAEFTDKLQEEYDQFLADFASIRAVEKQDSSWDKCPEGGLIPKSFIDLTTLTPKDAQTYQQYIRNNYSSDAPVYRGGMVTTAIASEQDVVRIFENYSGPGAGYLTAKRSYVSPASTNRIEPSVVARSLDAYNSLITNAYFKQHHPDLATESSDDLDIVQVINTHIGGDGKNPHFFDSPFVSTTFKESLATDWGSAADAIKFAKSGLVFTLRAPKFGGIFTFGIKWQNEVSDLPGLQAVYFRYANEREVLVPGAINPANIDSLVVNDITDDTNTLSRKSATAYRAQKQVTADGIFLEIENVANGTTTKYKLNPATNRYERL